MTVIKNRTVPCNPRSENYAKGTVVNVSGASSTSGFVYTPTYDDIINTLKNGKDYITIPTILEVYGDLYSLGEVSAFGAGSGGSSGGGLIQTVHGYSSLGGTFNNDTITDTFNAYTINQLHLRLSQVEVGASVNVAVSGAGNAITGVTKNGDVLEFTKGLTFSLASHTHTFASLTSKPTTLSGYGITDGLLASAYTASDILTKLKTVDGSGSGLDADLWRGYTPSNINVASATQLQTARTIWGQSFDGTGNVSGAMSGVTSLTMSGALSGGTTSSFSSYSTANRFYTGYDSGAGNSMSCSNWFRSNGPTGWYNDTYAGGITMIDSTYVRVYNNKSFWVDNNIVATGEITAFGASDIRLKDNLKPISSALDFLGRVKTYEFDWNEKALSLNPLKTKKGAGVIAQEMSLLDNNFVHSIYGDYLGVDYERFIPYLIGGVNEVADEVTILKKRVAELELEVKRLSV